MSMRRSVKLLLLLPVALVFSIAYSPNEAFALPVNYNNLIDDVIFDNQNTLSASQIDTFLNSFPGSCISSNNGFRAIDPTGYNPGDGYLYGGNVTAGKAIYDAAAAYEMNPEVLLATLQKEQSLVTGTAGCTTLQYAGAMGYGCPDGGTTHNYSGVNLYTLNGHTVTSVSGTCVNTSQKVGFSQQVIHAAWLLKFDRMRSEGKVTWAIIKPHWDNSDDLDTTYSGYMTQGTYQRCSSCAATFYDGYATIDGTSVHMDNGATASLYVYTPHKSGNNSFDTIYSSWFGSLQAPSYFASYSDHSPYPTITPGTNTTTYMSFTNSGHSIWYDDSSVDSAPFGSHAVHLATTNPINRSSLFSASWASRSRPTTVFAAVYESDGTTLAVDQHVVQPGQIAKFSFTLSAPVDIAPGTYKEYFQPVLEGTSDGTFNNPSSSIIVTIPRQFSAQFVSQSAYPEMQQNSVGSAFFTFRNVGYAPWHDSVSASSSGSKPVVLATTGPINRQSLFNTLFSSSNRPTRSFAAVYESDGTTLAVDQHVVQPGQIAKFSFTLSAPQNIKPGTYREDFQPILEGGSPWDMQQKVWLFITVTPATYKASYYRESPFPTIVRGNSSPVYFMLKNIGNVLWYDTASAPLGVKWVSLATTNPINRSSLFSASWASRSRPTTVFAAVYESDGTTLAVDQHVVQPGQIAKFSFTLSAPVDIAPGTYKEYFQPVLEQGSPWSLVQVLWTKIAITTS